MCLLLPFLTAFLLLQSAISAPKGRQSLQETGESSNLITFSLARDADLDQLLQDSSASLQRRPHFYLHQGDMLLTADQLLSYRQRAMGLPVRLWKRDKDGLLTIPYSFQDTVLNRTMMMEAMQNWESNTCIRFNHIHPPKGDVSIIMVPPSSPPYLNYVGGGPSCHTSVGADPKFEGPHHVFVGVVCDRTAAIHEMGHAFGMQHEQSRLDRDQSVVILWDNIMQQMKREFSLEFTLSYGVPYDFRSAMHFNPVGFSNGKGPTVRSRDPLYQSLMGSDDGLSFMDAKAFNTVYGCINEWRTKCGGKEDPCQNQGYMKYDRATETCGCHCPGGTSGANCETKTMEYNDAMVALTTPATEVLTSPGLVSTPGYPAPYTVTQFTKVLKAPKCKRAVLTMNQFSVHPRTDTTICEYDSLEVRLSTALESGTMYCGTEIEPGQRFVSNDSTIILHFMTYYGAQGEDYKFQGKLSFESIPNCS